MYDVLWDAGRPQTNGDRIVSLGVPTIAQRSYVHPRNVPVILQRLIAKRAITVERDEVSRTGTPRTYRVHSFKRILEFRAAAGLEWVVRGRGVEFVDPQTGVPLQLIPPPGVTPSPAPTSFHPPDVTSTGPHDATSGDPPAVTSAPSLDLKSLGKQSQELSSSSKEKLAQAMHEFGTKPDDDAVRLLVGSCRRKAPDSTFEEMEHFIREKGGLLRALLRASPARIANPTGFLITAVANCFEGESLQLLRAERQRTSEREVALARQADAEMAAQRLEAQALLENPEISEQERALLRRLLT